MEYPTSYRVVLDTPLYRLLCFKESNKHPSMLQLGAIAGHETQFTLGYKKGKSVSDSGVKHSPGGVFVLDIKAPKFPYLMLVTYNTHLEQVAECIRFIDNGPVRLVGVCQGGAMAAKFTTDHPDMVSELIIAASPINTSTKSDITPAQKIPYFMYHAAVVFNGWQMPGKVMLKAWMSQNKEKHEIESKKPENAYFYARYGEVQGIYGWAYLQMIQGWFLSLDFFNSLDVKCPVILIIGRKDRITPPEQTLALKNKCSNEVKTLYVGGGHFETFAGSEAHQPDGVWAEAFG